ncbi:ATP-binding protein [Thermodesulfovibrio hydrogeniphilus]
MIDRLIKSGIPCRNILFLSFDDISLRVDLDEIFKVYEQINKRLIKEVRTIYVFMDEAHFLENWQFMAKKYFDRKYPLKFIVSGSSASLIKKGTESLAGRTIEEIIFPFSFYEFLCFHLKKSNLIKKIDYMRDNFKDFKFLDLTELVPYESEIKIVFEEYVQKGGFPNLFHINEPLLWKRLVREDIVEKVIYRDLVGLYDIKKLEVLERLFLYLMDISSQFLNITNIANSLGLSREYTEKYLLYLDYAFLIKRLKKYSKSVEKSIRSAEKLHILDAGLINTFSKKDVGSVIESIIASHLLRMKDVMVYYYREKYEVDLVLEKDKALFPIEVKYQKDISNKDLRGIEAFSKKFKTEKVIDLKTFNISD